MGTRGNPATLVLADDHRQFAETCARLLAHEFEVLGTVSDGREAIAAVEEHDPDVLVLDLSMPGMSGIEVIEALRGRGARARIVVLTLDRDEAIADRVLSLGVAGFVTKPRVARDLGCAVRKAIAGESFRSPARS